jgi:S1-C subfamily serine protease
MTQVKNIVLSLALGVVLGAGMLNTSDARDLMPEGAFPPFGPGWPGLQAPRPLLGIAVAGIGFDALDRRGLSYGVEVGPVEEGAPGAKAGIKPGDVILSVNGQAAFSPARLVWLLGQQAGKAKVPLEVSRDGKTLQLTADLSAATRLPGGPMGRGEGHERAYLGILMQDLTPPLREAVGAEGHQGVLVAQVQEGSPAAQAGLKTGDLIVRIATKAITGPEDVYRALDYFDVGDTIDVAVVRNKAEQTLKVTLGSRPAGSHPSPLPFGGMGGPFGPAPGAAQPWGGYCPHALPGGPQGKTST